MLQATNTWDRLGKLQQKLGFSKKAKAAPNPATRHNQVRTGLAKFLMKLGVLTHSEHLTSMQQSKENNSFKG